MLNRIIVAIDGSKSAVHAAKCAIKLAKQVGAFIEIVYVVRNAIGNLDAGISPEEIEKHEKFKAEKLIQKIKGSYTDISIQDFEPIGKPVELIQKSIDLWNADVVIIGHHTHNFVERLFYGSVEEKLLKRLKIPMFILPEQYEC